MRRLTTIRRATTAYHIGAIAVLQATVLPSDKPCDTSEGSWWVVCADGEPIAFAGMRTSRRWTDCGYLCRSGVAPEWRGKGLQKQLIKARIAHAKRIGMRWLITDTTDNPASSNSLIACGFRLYEPIDPWGGKRTLYWRRKVAP